jgi:SAM-dependent methyltransferase
VTRAILPGGKGGVALNVNVAEVTPPPLLRDRSEIAQLLAVGLIAGAIIALQIGIMRIYAAGSWAHFGSLVVSLAMFGFSASAVVVYIGRGWFERNWKTAAALSMAAFGPLLVGANLLAQQLPFNAIFLVSDPTQKWRLAANFGLYFLPFFVGALFLGTLFLKKQKTFGRLYFADLTGSGIAGLMVLAAMYVLPPEQITFAPLVLWAAASLLWFGATSNRRVVGWTAGLIAVAFAAAIAVPAITGITTLAVNSYKGISYARNFPDAERIYRSISPFGDLQIYASSYMHFAPGLSDNAAFNLPEVPSNAYVGMYIDGDGPEGIMRNLPDKDTAYFRFLPMYYPYVINPAPKAFVVQFGGGISTTVALKSGATHVTVAESNPAVLAAFDDPKIREFTGDILRNPKVDVVPYEGRLFLSGKQGEYDLVDLSLADSVGLSGPGGFAIVEKYPYTREALATYMRALKPGGLLSVTLWNKEEPPKSILRFYATAVDAARDVGGDVASEFFASSTYLSTTTVLYKRGGFTPAEIAKLRAHTAAMSFDEIYSPGFVFDPKSAGKILDDYRASIFGNGEDALDGATATDGDPLGGGPPEDGVLPATSLGRLTWNALIFGGWEQLADRYVFDIHALSNDKPYFAAYVKPADLPAVTDRLSVLQDDWGYLLIWATLAVASLAAIVLISIPVVFGWRVAFSASRGKLGTVVYFACLGLGYIIVEVGLISRFVVALGNPTISASVLIGGMLVFSGIGSLASERILGRARNVLPFILAVVAVLLIAYGWGSPIALDWIGTLPYAVRLALCLLLVAPPAFLMGFPMPTAMASLARLGKTDMFVWAWGINGCFSVIGAAAVPILATTFGLGTVLAVGGVAYLVAIPAFFAVLLPSLTAPRVALA